MISITQRGLDEALRLHIKTSLQVEYLPAKLVAKRSEKNELFFASLISSMANTIGGTIFIGVNKKGRKPISFDALSDHSITEWLQMICQHQILPSIANCIITEIPVTEKTFVIGIQVPDSSLAPHMCDDYRFYHRIDTKTVLLEEHEIRDLYTKGKRPQIELFSVTNTAGIPTMVGGKFQKINFYPRFLVKNTGTSVEQFYKVELSVPSPINNPTFNTMQDHFSRFDDGNSIYTFTGKSALFQNEIASVVEPNFFVDYQSYNAFENGEISLTFFYSSGVQTKIFHCKELLLYRNKQIERDDFCKDQEILVDVVSRG